MELIRIILNVVDWSVATVVAISIVVIVAEMGMLGILYVILKPTYDYEPMFKSAKQKRKFLVVCAMLALAFIGAVEGGAYLYQYSKAISILAYMFTMAFAMCVIRLAILGDAQDNSYAIVVRR